MVNHNKMLSLVLKNMSSFLSKDSPEVTWTSSVGRESQHLTTLEEYKLCLQSVLPSWVYSFWVLPIRFVLGLSLSRCLRGCPEVLRIL